MTASRKERAAFFPTATAVTNHPVYALATLPAEPFHLTPVRSILFSRTCIGTRRCSVYRGETAAPKGA